MANALIEQGDRTTLILTIRCQSKEARDTVLKSTVEQGIALSYDRLATLLAKESAA